MMIQDWEDWEVVGCEVAKACGYGGCPQLLAYRKIIYIRKALKYVLNKNFVLVNLLDVSD